MKSKSPKPTVAILATLDTKGSEVTFLKDCLGEAGVQVLVIDGGIMGRATSPADIPASVLARKAGSSLNRPTPSGPRREGHGDHDPGGHPGRSGPLSPGGNRWSDRSGRLHGDLPGHRGHAVPAFRFS